LHWSEEEQVYCDATIDDFGFLLDVLIIEDDKLVCHKGYISIFPLLLGLVPADSPHLSALLDMMADPDHLWSPHGLRSLSRSDEFYSTGENYWRGPIWVNMNYLALSSLYKVPPSSR
jgi:mannosyl-oligosaccharide glucosidase